MTPETYRAAIAEMDRTAHVDMPYSEYVAAREHWSSITQPSLVAALLDALDGYRVDAERYRWLCTHAIVPKPSLWDRGIGFVCDLAGLPMRGTVTKQGLDAAIDAARKPA